MLTRSSSTTSSLVVEAAGFLVLLLLLFTRQARIIQVLWEVKVPMSLSFKQIW
jgi:hypothetical protein